MLKRINHGFNSASSKSKWCVFVMQKIIAISVMLWIGDVLEAGKLVLEKIQTVKTSAYYFAM